MFTASHAFRVESRDHPAAWESHGCTGKPDAPGSEHSAARGWGSDNMKHACMQGLFGLGTDLLNYEFAIHN